MTATQIKNYIEENSRQQIKNMKYFGRELKNIYGKPTQKRGLGFVYIVIKKNNTNSPISSGVLPSETSQNDNDDEPF